MTKIEQQATLKKQTPRVLLIASDGNGHSYYYPRHYSLVDDMVEGAGGSYIDLGDIYFELSIEAIVEQNPDIILFTTFQSDGQENYVRALQTDKRLQTITAIEQQKVMEIDYLQAMRGDVTFINLYKEIAQFIQPTLFKENN